MVILISNQFSHTFSGTISGITMNDNGKIPKCKLNAATAMKSIGNEVAVFEFTSNITYIIWDIIIPVIDASNRHCK